QPPAQEAQVTLPITGMSCAACAARIEKQLRRTPGVREANVNFATNRAAVTYDPGACDTRELAETVEQSGYGGRRAEARLRLASDAQSAEAVRALYRIPGILDAGVEDGELVIRYLAETIEPASLHRALHAAGVELIEPPDGGIPEEESPEDAERAEREAE